MLRGVLDSVKVLAAPDVVSMKVVGKQVVGCFICMPSRRPRFNPAQRPDSGCFGLCSVATEWMLGKEEAGVGLPRN